MLPRLLDHRSPHSWIFLRLYWFEKRFQHVAREARLRRGTVSKAKTAAKLDNAGLERGVDGRKITVMLDGTRSRITNDGMLLEGNQPPSDELNPKSSSSDQSGTDAAARHEL